jgi:chromosome segregation protein
MPLGVNGPPWDRGAHSHKCDFQVHTPRDTNWRGERAVTDVQRRAFAEELVAAARSKGVQAMAITDHHDFVMVPFVRAAAISERAEDGSQVPPDSRITVFPGLELTLGVPCQALLILDADIPDSQLPLVLGSLSIDPADPSLASLPSVKRLDHFHTLGALHEALNTHGWLQGRYIVLPNVTDGGLGTLMRSGMQAKYKDMPCIGGYLDGTVESKVGEGNRRIFAGRDPNYGNKPLALFQTSDSRSSDFADLGKHSTWVKWATPTAEALRQACLAQESRISQSEPPLPGVFISRLAVSNSKFLGPVDLSLNPQYNALIGGRGTGKSTLLDYLRWCVCDQPPDAADEDVSNPRQRQRRLVEATLEPLGATVEVHFTINAIPHVVRRLARTGEVLLKVAQGQFEKARESDIRALLPIHAYSQKQLSGVSIRADELTRFITAPIQLRLDGADRRSSEIAGRLRENYATLQRFRDLTAGVARSELAVRSLGEQAAMLRSALPGLSEVDQLVLAQKTPVEHSRDDIERWQRDLDVAVAAATELAQQLEDSLPGPAMQPTLPNGLADSILALQSGTSSVARELRDAIVSAVERVELALSEGGTLQRLRADTANALEAFDRSYDEVKARSTAHQAKLAELSDVENRRKAANDLLQEQQRQLKLLGDPLAAHKRLRSELVATYKERSGLLAAQCEELNRLSEGLLKAEIRSGRGFEDVEAKFRGLVAGSGLRGSRVETLFAGLREESEPLDTWQGVLTELEVVLLVGPEGELTSEVTPTLSRLGVPVADQRKVQARMSADGWLDLALTPVRDWPVFWYRTKEQEFIRFEAASAGQQATTLLRILLAQTGMPLVIDQPEEDLDSQVIQDVVGRVWKAKQGRQIIFASHNANLVVNGDAELVVVCDYRAAPDQSGGHLKIEGAIDVTPVRNEITRIMEGGEKAFRLRKEKYGF